MKMLGGNRYLETNKDFNCLCVILLFDCCNKLKPESSNIILIFKFLTHKPST